MPGDQPARETEIENRISREKEFEIIGSTLDDEEGYLIEISDRDARDGETYINLTDYPQLMLESWYFEICTRTRMAYIKKWGIGKFF